MEEMNEILYDMEKENNKIIDFNNQQNQDIQELDEIIKKLNKKYKTVDVIIKKKEYSDTFKLFYFKQINKYFILLYIIKNKNLIKYRINYIIELIENLQYFLHMSPFDNKTKNMYNLIVNNKKNIMYKSMEEFNDYYLSFKNYGKSKNLLMDDYYLLYEKNNKLIDTSISLYIYLKKKKIKVFFFNEIKDIFQNTIQKSDIFKAFLENSKDNYIYYFTYYLQKKFPHLNIYEDLMTQFDKWYNEDYEFDDISILYLYHHYRIIYIDYNIEEIKLELDKIENLYQQFIEI